MTNCWYCGSKMIWNNDFNYEDYHYEGEGIVSVLSCSNPDCGAMCEFSQRFDDAEEE